MRVQTVVIALRKWEMTPAQIADEYTVEVSLVLETLAFYDVHRHEIDASMAAEEELERIGA